MTNPARTLKQKSSTPERKIIYEWQTCDFEEIKPLLLKMRKNDWHPVSHSIWYDQRSGTKASFIFKKIVHITEK